MLLIQVLIQVLIQDFRDTIVVEVEGDIQDVDGGGEVIIKE